MVAQVCNLSQMSHLRPGWASAKRGNQVSGHTSAVLAQRQIPSLRPAWATLDTVFFFFYFKEKRNREARRCLKLRLTLSLTPSTRPLKRWSVSNPDWGKTARQIFFHVKRSLLGWDTPLIPALGGQRQEDLWVQRQPSQQNKFQASQSYVERRCLKEQSTTNQNHLS